MYSRGLGRKNNPSWARLLAIVAVCAAGWGFVACGAQHDPGDSSTHFWQTCNADEECGENYQCLCGRCSESCNRPADCSTPQAVCIAASALAECSLEGNVCATQTAIKERPDAGGATSVGTAADSNDSATRSDEESIPTSEVTQNSDAADSSTVSSASTSTSSDSDPDTTDVAAPTPSLWSPIIDVEPAQNFAFAPLVTVDDEGNSVVMWTVGIAETGYSLVVNTHRADAGWGDEVHLAAGPSFLSRQCMSTSPNGAMIAAWVAESETGSQVWTALFEREAGWSQSTTIGEQSAQINDTGCALDAAGNAIVTWTAHDGTKAVLNAVRFEPVAGWSEPQRLDETDAHVSTSSLALDSAGNALVLWNASRGDADELWANRYLPSEGWQAPVRMPSTPGSRVNGIHLAMTSAGDGVGLWSEQTNDGTQNTLLAIAVTSDGTWQEAEVLASGTDGFSNARVGVIGPQAVVAVWEAFRPTGVVGENRIFARTRNESDWQEPRLLAEDAAWVSLAVSPTGHAVAAWRTPLDYMVDGDVVVAHYNHQQLAWGDALVLNEGMAGDTSSVHASINGNGQACLVWEQSVEDPGGYIMFTRADYLE